MKEKLLSFALFCIYFNLNAQQYSQTVKGKVVDKDSQKPLWGTTIAILNSEPFKGGVTDSAGKFKISQVPIGRYNIKISYIGYEELILKEVLVGYGKEITINAEIQESAVKIQEVVIKASQSKGEVNNSMAIVSGRTFSVVDASRYAGGFGDPSRMAASFAGATTSDDENNEIVIRGNSPRGILWMLEGIEIPNPNHFRDGEGASGGGVSLLSNNTLANSDFFTGAFAPEYGNALSGVFDIKLRKGNTDKREYAFQLGVLGGEATLEVPISKKSEASYLVNYRYAIFELINKIGIRTSDNFNEIVPQFQDATYTIFLPTKKSGNFNFWGVGGKSRAGQLAPKIQRYG